MQRTEQQIGGRRSARFFPFCEWGIEPCGILNQAGISAWFKNGDRHLAGMRFPAG